MIHLYLLTLSISCMIVGFLICLLIYQFKRIKFNSYYLNDAVKSYIDIIASHAASTTLIYEHHESLGTDEHKKHLDNYDNNFKIYKEKYTQELKEVFNYD